MRESDTVARMGGDEFAILLPTASYLDGATVVARKILGQRSPCRSRSAIETSTSAPAWESALFPEHGNETDILMRAADAAMYEAKRTQGGFRNLSLRTGPETRDRLTSHVNRCAVAIAAARLNPARATPSPSARFGSNQVGLLGRHDFTGIGRRPSCREWTSGTSVNATAISPEFTRCSNSFSPRIPPTKSMRLSRGAGRPAPRIGASRLSCNKPRRDASPGRGRVRVRDGVQTVPGTLEVPAELKPAFDGLTVVSPWVDREGRLQLRQKRISIAPVQILDHAVVIQDLHLVVRKGHGEEIVVRLLAGRVRVGVATRVRERAAAAER